MSNRREGRRRELNEWNNWIYIYIYIYLNNRPDKTNDSRSSITHYFLGGKEYTLQLININLFLKEC